MLQAARNSPSAFTPPTTSSSPASRFPAGTTLAKENAARRGRAFPPATRSPCARSRRAAPSALQPDHRLRHARHRAPATHVHVHNLAMGDFRARLRLLRRCEADRSTSRSPATFQGIVRADGRVATRNYIGILTSVNCSATVARMIARSFREPPRSVSRTSTAWSRSRTRAAAAWRAKARRWTCCAAPWPATRATRISSPCRSWAWAARRTRSTTCSPRSSSSAATGSPPTPSRRRAARMKAVREGIARIEAMLPEANKVKRETVPASHLMLAPAMRRLGRLLRASRANPALGAAVDLLVRHGGTRDPLGDAGDLRRRAPAHAPRGHRARSGEKLVAPHPLVGGLHRAQRQRDEQQPLARQQGGRAHHDPGEVARRGGQGRHHQSRRRLRVRRAGDRQGLRLHGHARASTRCRRPARSRAAPT